MRKTRKIVKYLSFFEIINIYLGFLISHRIRNTMGIKEAYNKQQQSKLNLLITNDYGFTPLKPFFRPSLSASKFTRLFLLGIFKRIKPSFLFSSAKGRVIQKSLTNQCNKQIIPINKFNINKNNKHI